MMREACVRIRRNEIQEDAILVQNVLRVCSLAFGFEVYHSKRRLLLLRSESGLRISACGRAGVMGAVNSAFCFR